MSLMLVFNALPKSVMILPGRDGIPEDFCIISVVAKFRIELTTRGRNFGEKKELTIAKLETYSSMQVLHYQAVVQELVSGSIKLMLHILR